MFKQKTAYELRISDWSSDVCSSDLEKVRRDRPSALMALLRRSAMRRARHRAWRPKARPSTWTAWPRSRDRKRVVQGKRGSVRVDLGGRRILKKKTTNSE